MKIEQDEIRNALDFFYKQAGPNAYFGNGFNAGVEFAIQQANDLLRQVSVFSLGKCPLYNREVYIRTRGQMYGPDKWICMLENSKGWCLGKNNRWYYEMNPSSRTDAFLNQTRFDTHEEARAAYQSHLKKGKVHKLTL